MSRRWYDNSNESSIHDVGTDVMTTLGGLFFIILATGVIGTLLGASVGKYIFGFMVSLIGARFINIKFKWFFSDFIVFMLGSIILSAILSLW